MDPKIHTALQTVLREAKGGCAEYAKTYARAALLRDMSGEELRVQCLYVLTNLSHWRGKTARAVKAKLKEAGHAST